MANLPNMGRNKSNQSHGSKKTGLVNLPKAITPVMEILKINKNKNQEEYKYEHKIT